MLRRISRSGRSLDVAQTPVLARQTRLAPRTATHTHSPTLHTSTVPHSTHAPQSPTPQLPLLPHFVQSLLSHNSRGQAPLGHCPPDTNYDRSGPSPMSARGAGAAWASTAWSTRMGRLGAINMKGHTSSALNVAIKSDSSVTVPTQIETPTLKAPRKSELGSAERSS